MPGSHVPCATKQLTALGPEHIYCAIGFGIPSDRKKSAVTITEDVGSILDTGDTETEILGRLAQSILQIGINQSIAIKEIYLSVKTLCLKEGEIGCVLAAVPYFAIAKRALCNKDLVKLKDMNLCEWQKAHNT